MTEHDPRPLSVGVKCTVMILTIILVTIFTIMAVTFLCTHYTSGRSEIPESTDIHRHTDLSSNDRNGLSEKSTSPVVVLDESGTPADRGLPRITPTESVSDSAVDQQVSKFHSAKHPWTGDSGRTLVGQGRLTAKTIPYPAVQNREDVADHAIELWDINSQSNRHNYQNTESDEWAGHHASYDFTNSLDHNDAFKYSDADLHGGIELRPHHSFGNEAYYRPIAESSSTMHYRPPLRPPPIYPVLSPQTKISISKKEKFDWHTIGLLTLVKVGLIKLKLFGILKILFLLLFKLKLFLIAMFIKFFLLLKASKLFKTLFLPLLILPLFLILMALILPIIMSAMYLLPTQSPNMMSPAAPTFTLSNLLSNLISNLPGIPSQPGSTKSFMSDQFSNILKNTQASRSGTFKFNDLNLHNKRDKEPLVTIDTALNIFQHLLDSETCVERIACQMAAVGKTAGIMPDWMNRLLNSILSMFIAIEKRKTHVKTYDDVNNDIIINFLTPASWTKWCMDRYDCNRTIISNTTETEL